ncbi:MAG: hypothetical protein EU981_00080 [Candidatus Liberibacter ctenarytainae]|uniref:Uncharacterized protein n=1 Tax=Candidatus Liberibacter ctenarytainae TaxID=2020335 RepID=A0A937AR23_9HYPH|nr:hypothetical protein [Candidatus Liberibacter ctenarytainae]
MSTLNDYRIQIILKRLMEVIDNENIHLKNHTPFDISASNDHKGRCLHELSLLFPSFKDISCDHSEKIHMLHQKLSLNAHLLESYLVSARMIADLFKRKLQDMDSDGTYSRI